MVSWLLLGGCLAGFIALEATARCWFPGGQLSWISQVRGILRREKLWGGACNNAAPSILRWQHKQRYYQDLQARLETLSPEDQIDFLVQLEESLKQFPDQVLNCILLAQAWSQAGYPEDAHDQVEKARELLRNNWYPAHSTFQSLSSRVYEAKASLDLLSGLPDQALVACQEAETLCEQGHSNWIPRVRLQAQLLAGDLDAASATIDSASSGEDWTLQLLQVEFCLQGREFECAAEQLSAIPVKRLISLESKLHYCRLQVECEIASGSGEEVWRYIGYLHTLCRKYPHHMGVRRTYHTTCTKALLQQGAYADAREHLSEAYEYAPYPVARWDLMTVEGALLEARGRDREASQLWADLRSEAEGTWFANLGSARSIRMDDPSQVARTRLYALLSSGN